MILAVHQMQFRKELGKLTPQNLTSEALVYVLLSIPFNRDRS